MGGFCTEEAWDLESAHDNDLCMIESKAYLHSHNFLSIEYPVVLYFGARVRRSALKLDVGGRQ